MSQILFSTAIQPDVEELLTVLRRERAPKCLHFIELVLDPEVIEALDQRFQLSVELHDSVPFHKLKRDIQVHAFLGYDAFRFGFVPKDIFPIPSLESDDTAPSPAPETMSTALVTSPNSSSVVHWSWFYETTVEEVLLTQACITFLRLLLKTKKKPLR